MTNKDRDTGDCEATVRILASARGGLEALKRLYELKRLENPRFSLAVMARASGIASKGYLSEVLRGKRPLGNAYAGAVAGALGLSGLQVRLLEKLLHRDVCDKAERATIDTELDAMRRALAAPVGTMPQRLALDFFAVEVFCASGLYGGRPTREQLVGYFGRERAFEVDAALAALVSTGYMEKNEQTYALTQRNVAFSDEIGALGHLEFLRHAILDAAKAAPKWFPKRDQAHLEATIISVNSARYSTLLARLKDDLLKWQAELETEQADMLVRFNVQVYPLG